MAKTKALISFAVTAKLICVLVFAYAKSRFSHDAAHIYSLYRRCLCEPFHLYLIAATVARFNFYDRSTAPTHVQFHTSNFSFTLRVLGVKSTEVFPVACRKAFGSVDRKSFLFFCLFSIC